MPELRRGERRNRAPSLDLRRKRRAAAAGRKSEHKVGNYIRTRAAVAKEAADAAGAVVVVEKERGKNRVGKKTRTRLGVGRKRAKVAEGAAAAADKKGVKAVCVEEVGVGGGEGVQCENLREAMVGDNSGGLSANKVTGQEEEGSTSPFPERVSLSIHLSFYLSKCVNVCICA